MFFHEFKYSIITLLKDKSSLIWTLLFPIALGTFMYMSFGTVYEKDNVFTEIPVAVIENVENKAFSEMLNELSEEGEDKLLEVSYMNEDEAKEAINADKIAGIIYMDEEIRLAVAENGYNSTVLESILNEYLKREAMLTDIAMKTPEKLENAVNDMMSESEFYTSKITSDGNQDVYTNYFYAIFAMSCMFASFGANTKISNIQANVSSLGMRRCLSPNDKGITIVSAFLSILIVQFVVEVISLIYFNAIGVDFGNRFLPMIGILFFGCCIGIAIGFIVGALWKLSENTKMGLCVWIGMVLSIMADLVASGVKDMIEHTLPIINRINPAALIVDSFYALNIYDTYDRYFRNMATLAGETILLLVVCFLTLRRNKYASV